MAGVRQPLSTRDGPADALAGTDGLEVRFYPSLPPHAQRLLATLGVRVIFDFAAPRHPLTDLGDVAARERSRKRRAGLRAEREAAGIAAEDAL